MRLLLSIALAAAALAAQTFSGGPAIDRAIGDAIEQGNLPGAVVVIGHDGRVVYEKAYGRRAIVPAPEAMTADTIFDLASLTKVVATTTALMKLFEQGRFRLNDKVTDYIPEFQGGKSDITLRNLFTHFSGLQAGSAARSNRGAVTRPASTSPARIRPPGRRARASSIATSISSCWANWCIA